MTRRRIALAGTVAAIAATVLLLGGVLREAEPLGAGAATSPVTLSPATPDQFGPQFAAGPTADAIEDLQARLRSRPDDAETAIALGLAYQQRVRETADFTYLTRSDALLRRALRLDPDNADAVGGLATLALSRHDFGRALTLGRRARALAPATARHHGVVGDALLELGRYEQAFDAFDRMAQLKPGVASYARVSYARELLGDTEGARDAMTLAADAASGQREALAWTHVQLGKLELGRGELERSDRHFRTALEVLPNYPFAFEARAQVELARGDYEAAVVLARRAADQVPLPQFVATLADVYRAGDKKAEAREQYGVMRAIEKLLRASGVRSDLELTAFNVDHGIDLEHAVEQARRVRRARPSIEADDVLAWALARTGRCEEARRYSQRSLRLGTRDASKIFHRGMIERCLGEEREARTWFRRALETNPHFSAYWAPVARRYAG